MSDRIPDFQTLILPLMQVISDEQQHQVNDVYEKLCDKYKVEHGLETYDFILKNKQ